MSESAMTKSIGWLEATRTLYITRVTRSQKCELPDTVTELNASSVLPQFFRHSKKRVDRSLRYPLLAPCIGQRLT